MADHELGRLRAALASALGEALEADAFDLVEDAAGSLDVMTDDWTLRVEGWSGGIAFVTIDDEPADTDELRQARQAAMPVAVEHALATADRELDGALAAALRASQDPLSLDLARALTQRQAERA